MNARLFVSAALAFVAVSFPSPSASAGLSVSLVDDEGTPFCDGMRFDLRSYPLLLGSRTGCAADPLFGYVVGSSMLVFTTDAAAPDAVFLYLFDFNTLTWMNVRSEGGAMVPALGGKFTFVFATPAGREPGGGGSDQASGKRARKRQRR